MTERTLPVHGHVCLRPTIEPLPRDASRDPVADRRARALLSGLATSTFSTLFVTFGGRHVGRDPQLDFQQISTWVLGDRGVTPRADHARVGAGVASHQFADVFWATIFFRWVLPRLPGRQRDAILGATVPWALGTAVAEYWVFLPWIQPWLRMQVPYWTVALAHLGSTAAYPVQPLIQSLRGDEVDEADRRAGTATAWGLGLTLSGMAALWWWSKQRGDVRWPGVRQDGEEASFLYRMTGHHEVGLRLAQLAAERASTHDLRKLGQLIALQHRAELDLMGHWHRSWFDRPVPPLADEDRRAMTGMPTPDAVDQLGALPPTAFDLSFAQVMIPHHAGAVEMSREATRRARDPRVRLLGAAIRHSQVRQVREIRRHT